MGILTSEKKEKSESNAPTTTFKRDKEIIAGKIAA
jgi:hypothetical protein